MRTAHVPSSATICIAAMLALAVAMGVGRFAFTPLFPLMVRDGLLDADAGALLAAANYLGYVAGALLAGRVHAPLGRQVALSLAGTVAVTAAMGWTGAPPAWAVLRFLAGGLSAWALVATTAWALGWLAAQGRSHWAGIVFSGVGLGIAAAGVFCLLAARPGVLAQSLWMELAALAALAALPPLLASRNASAPAGPDTRTNTGAPRRGGGLVACYGLLGFGYILPATYLPAMARQLVDDPRIFGWAWPVFGAAAALSTLAAAKAMRRYGRIRVWAASHLLMALGVLLPALAATLAGITAAALLVGGTFMVATLAAMQEAQARGGANAAPMLARMTAGFACGQLLGPVAAWVLARLPAIGGDPLRPALVLACAGLAGSALYLWREARHAVPT